VRGGQCRGSGAASHVEHALTARSHRQIDEKPFERLEQPVQHIPQLYPRPAAQIAPKSRLVVVGFAPFLQLRSPSAFLVPARPSAVSLRFAGLDTMPQARAGTLHGIFITSTERLKRRGRRFRGKVGFARPEGEEGSRC
jgi:hypothetical protein